jgi:diaminopimelate decarboxylase
MTQWMQFIHMRPNIVMIDMDGNVNLVREKETLDTMLRYERVPEHLQVKK